MCASARTAGQTGAYNKIAMRALVFLSVTFLPALYPQTATSPELATEFFNRTGMVPLKCQVRQIAPALDFGFRFHAGFALSVPFSQYRGDGHSWTVGLRIEPETGGPPVFLMDRLDLPPVHSNRLTAETNGEFLLGEGSYRASLLVVDDEGRGCRAQWRYDAQLKPSDRPVKLAIAPGAIQAVNAPVAFGPSPAAEPPVDKLTVFLDAAPVSPTLAGLHPGDAATLVTSLVSLMNQVPARTVKLVVFNLDQQIELYRQENFTLDQLDKVRRAISSLQLGVVAYRTLGNPNGYLDQLTDLAKEETGADSPSHLVVFMGAHSRFNGKPLADDAMERQGPGAPKFFYLEFLRPVALPLAGDPAPDSWVDASSGAPGSALSSSDALDYAEAVADATALPSNYHPTQQDESRDAIDHLISSLKGRTMIVRKPCDLARAMLQITAAR